MSIGAILKKRFNECPHGYTNSSSLDKRLYSDFDGNPHFDVSNTKTRYVDYSKSRKKQMRNKIQLNKWKTGSDPVDNGIRNNLYAFIPKFFGFIN